MITLTLISFALSKERNINNERMIRNDDIICFIKYNNPYRKRTNNNWVNFLNILNVLTSSFETEKFTKINGDMW